MPGSRLLCPDEEAQITPASASSSSTGRASECHPGPAERCLIVLRFCRGTGLIGLPPPGRRLVRWWSLCSPVQRTAPTGASVGWRQYAGDGAGEGKSPDEVRDLMTRVRSGAGSDGWIETPMVRNGLGDDLRARGGTADDALLPRAACSKPASRRCTAKRKEPSICRRLVGAMPWCFASDAPGSRGGVTISNRPPRVLVPGGALALDPHCP
jgi:hypothetical protein